MHLAIGLVEIVVFRKTGGGKQDICHPRSLRHKLLMDADEKILSGKTTPHQVEIRCHRHRIGILDKQRPDLRSAAQICWITAQNSPDPRHIQHAGSGTLRIQTFDQPFVQLEQIAAAEQCAASRKLPSAGDCWQTTHGVDVERAVAAARKTQSEPNKAASGLAIQLGELFDLCCGDTGYRCCPGGCAGGQV